MALSVPTIKVNNDVVPIVPNSYKYTPGDGETKVRAASTGGGGAKAIHTQDAETMCSKVTFQVYPETKEIGLIRVWKQAVGTLTVQHSQTSDGIAESFQHMSVTNDPEVTASADGILTVEMAGDKLP